MVPLLIIFYRKINCFSRKIQKSIYVRKFECNRCTVVKHYSLYYGNFQKTQSLMIFSKRQGLVILLFRGGGVGVRGHGSRLGKNGPVSFREESVGIV